MKQIMAGLLSVILMISLFGCSKKASDIPGQPDTPPQASDESVVLPEGPLYLLTAEYGRLYAVNAAGEGTLLRDAYCTAFDRRGDLAVAAFDNGEIYLFDLSTGSERLLTTDKLPAYFIMMTDSGFFCIISTISESYSYYFDFASGKQAEIEDLGWSFATDGSMLYYFSWNEGTTLHSFDTVTMQPVAEIPIAFSPWQMLALDGEVYFQEDRWSGGQWYRVDWENQTSEPAEIDLPTDYGTVITHHGTSFLMQDSFYDSEHRGCWFWKDGEATPIYEILSADNNWTDFCDEADGIVLLKNSTYYAENENDPVPTNVLYYTTARYILCDLQSGECKELPFVSDTAKLFADGDFPILDSSTARQPVTNSLYSLFCLQSQAGGTKPLCSTTHGAWTNLADRTIDIALLAEPTAEEQAYLTEKGVDIEMKLYGGDGLVFIGNDACGVTDLTLEQVRSIYRGEITNWSELGGVDADIHVLYRDDQSGSQRLFEKLVWGTEEVPDFAAQGFEILDEMSSIVSCCLYDPYAIGYSIMTYLNDVYKNEDLLAFSLNGVEASPEQVAAAKYPLGTKGYVVIRADEAENSPARRLYNWIGCSISDELLRNNGVTPLHG